MKLHAVTVLNLYLSIISGKSKPMANGHVRNDQDTEHTAEESLR